MSKAVRKLQTTSEILGRRKGFWSQQRWLRSQSSPVKLERAGRSGRFPNIIPTAAAVGGIWANGVAPVMTLC